MAAQSGPHVQLKLKETRKKEGGGGGGGAHILEENDNEGRSKIERENLHLLSTIYGDRVVGIRRAKI